MVADGVWFGLLALVIGGAMLWVGMRPHPQPQPVRMTKPELLDTLRELARLGNRAQAHIDADYALLEYIGDNEVSNAYEDIPRWYA